jgi:hypothetical protein
MMKARKPFAAVGVFAVAALSASPAYAGAGANVSACVYFATKPSTQLVVSITPAGSGTHCMNDTGSATSITVTGPGVSCASVGYVEAKASSTKGDLCATQSSNWPLAYSIAGTAYSGQTQTEWHTGTSNNSIDLQNQPAGTSVCGNSTLCPATSWTWNAGTQGPLYIIFQPGYSGK